MGSKRVVRVVLCIRFPTKVYFPEVRARKRGDSSCLAIGWELVAIGRKKRRERPNSIYSGCVLRKGGKKKLLLLLKKSGVVAEDHVKKNSEGGFRR